MLTDFHTFFGDGNITGPLIDIGVIVIQLILCHTAKKHVLRFLPVYAAVISMMLGMIALTGADGLAFFVFFTPAMVADISFAWIIYGIGCFLGSRTERANIVRCAVSVSMLLLYIGMLIWSGILVIDYSAKVGADHTVYWRGAEYVPVSGECREGKIIAKADGGWNILEAAGDRSHTYIFLQSYHEQYLLVRSDHVHGGEVTGVYCGREMYADDDLIDAVSEVINGVGGSGSVYSELYNGVYPVFRCYDGYPVGDEFAGYIVTSDGVWYFAPDGISFDGDVKCYEIPDELADTFRKYLTQ